MCCITLFFFLRAQYGNLTSGKCKNIDIFHIELVYPMFVLYCFQTLNNDSGDNMDCFSIHFVAISLVNCHWFWFS